ncbi:MAG: efflux RND transporter periplasmic adaptor subunit [Gammaproteobacteria bacterium HGW-Gammaproteobacteria-14]|nr:MAG: efflux RND transporter periplasmic adaptor subunit [Gammaproteobacteria bacterium HGW-Gammaproteobacteria-14]
MATKLTQRGLLIAFVLLLTACGNGGDSAPAVTVRVASVSSGEAQEPLRFAGVVRARQRAELTFQVSGTLQERSVELGSSVSAGMLLARLQNPQLLPARDSARARLREAEAQARQAEQEYQRGLPLRERGVLSEQNIEQLQARRDATRAAVDTARASLAEAEQLVREGELRAPFGGVVEAVLAEPGEFVAAGQPVMRISSPQGLEVEVRIPESLRVGIEPGMPLPVWRVMDRDSVALTGVVAEIGRGSRRGELYPLVVSLDEASLVPGVAVEVGVSRKVMEALALPVLAVVRSADGTAVFRVRNSIAERVPVTVLQLAGEQVLVRSDAIVAGDQVVYAGLSRLLDGDTVVVRP